MGAEQRNSAPDPPQGGHTSMQPDPASIRPASADLKTCVIIMYFEQLRRKHCFPCKEQYMFLKDTH